MSESFYTQLKGLEVLPTHILLRDRENVIICSGLDSLAQPDYVPPQALATRYFAWLLSLIVDSKMYIATKQLCNPFIGPIATKVLT